MKNQTLRVIGGELKSRKISFPNISGISLRPTSDRTRETLFNWLAFDVTNTRCLDAFAGSGSLGIEALSRGAKDCTFYEVNRNVFIKLKSNLELLKIDGKSKLFPRPFNLKNTETTQPYDLIFLDPPFNKGLLTEALEIIRTNHLLKNKGKIYFEAESNFDITALEKEWNILKIKKSGDVIFGLLQINN
ncbi:16S rRNA (guanine(966)-N(2))-methyltransferase RsmD [Francisellaceae bacterium]|nr:16S rRNA (guanine(966)-N(2))-methyltransferase RsmD [Francisellaceae bacterium]